MDAKGLLLVSVIVIALLLLVYYSSVLSRLLCGRSESFVSAKAKQVYQSSKEVFDESEGNATYSEYKQRVPGADPVVYTDTRNLYKADRLTPEAVERVV